MFKSILDVVVIILLAIGAIGFLLKLLYLFFKPTWLQRIRFISAPPTKAMLAICYVVIIMICIRGAMDKLGQF